MTSDVRRATVFLAAQLMVESGMTSNEDVRAVAAKIRASIDPPSIAPADEFLCPITKEVMNEAFIVVGTGITYEKTAIENWFAMGKFSGKRAYVFVMDGVAHCLFL